MSAAISTKKKNINTEFLKKTIGYVTGATGGYISHVMPVTSSTISGARETARELQSTFTSSSKTINQNIIDMKKQLTFRKITDWYLQKEEEFNMDGDFDNQLDFDTDVDIATTAKAQISELDKNANQISKSVVESSHKMVEASLSSTANLISSIDQQTAVISSGFDKTNVTLNKILEVLTKNTATMIESMHPSERKNAKDRLIDGKMDGNWFNDYKKIIKGNIANSEIGVLQSMIQMVPMLIKRTDPRDIFQVALGAGVNKFAPKAKKNMKSLDDMIGDVVMGSLLRLGDRQYKGGITGEFAKIFGINSNRNNAKTNTSSLEMKAVPFDTVAKEALTQAIPGYLRQILVQLGGRDLTYDFRSRQFKSRGTIKQQFQDNVVGTGLGGSWNGSRNLKNHTGNMTENDHMLFDMMIADMGWSNNGTGGVEKARSLSGMSKQQLTKYLHDLSKSLQGKVDIGNMIAIMTSIAGDEFAVNDIVSIVAKENFHRNKRVNEETQKASIMGDKLDDIKDGREGDIEAIARAYDRLAKSDVNIKHSSGPLGGVEYTNRALYAIYSRLQLGLNVYQTGSGQHRDIPYPRFQKNWLPVPNGMREMRDENREASISRNTKNFMNTEKAKPVVGQDGEPVGPGKAIVERGKDLGRAVLFGNAEDVQVAFGALMSDTTSQISGFLKQKLLGNKTVQGLKEDGKGILTNFTNGIEDFFKGKKGKDGIQAPNLFDFIFKGKRSDDPEDDTKRKKVIGAIAGTLVTSGLGILTGPIGLLLGGLAGSAVTTSSMGKKIHIMVMGDGDKKVGIVGRIGGLFKRILGYDKPMSEGAKDKRKRTQVLGALGGLMTGSHLGLIGGPVMMILAGLAGAAISTSGIGDKIQETLFGKKVQGKDGGTERIGGLINKVFAPVGKSIMGIGKLILLPFKGISKLTGHLKKKILDPLLGIGMGIKDQLFGNKKRKVIGFLPGLLNNTIGIVMKDAKELIGGGIRAISHKILDPISDIVSLATRKAKRKIGNFFMGSKDKKTGKYSGGLFSPFRNAVADAGKKFKDGMFGMLKTIFAAPGAILRMLFSKDARDKEGGIGGAVKRLGNAFNKGRKSGGISRGLKIMGQSMGYIGRKGTSKFEGLTGAADRFATSGETEEEMRDRGMSEKEISRVLADRESDAEFIRNRRWSRIKRRGDVKDAEEFHSKERTEMDAALAKSAEITAEKTEEMNRIQQEAFPHLSELAKRGNTPGSIYTHDTHLEERDEKKIDLLESILNNLNGNTGSNIPPTQSSISGEGRQFNSQQQIQNKKGKPSVLNAAVGAGTQGGLDNTDIQDIEIIINEENKDTPNEKSIFNRFKKILKRNKDKVEEGGEKKESFFDKLLGGIGGGINSLFSNLLPMLLGGLVLFNKDIRDMATGAIKDIGGWLIRKLPEGLNWLKETSTEDKYKDEYDEDGNLIAEGKEKGDPTRYAEMSSNFVNFFSPITKSFFGMDAGHTMGVVKTLNKTKKIVTNVIKNPSKSFKNMMNVTKNIPSAIKGISPMMKNIPNVIKNIPNNIKNIPNSIKNIPKTLETAKIARQTAAMHAARITEKGLKTGIKVGATVGKGAISGLKLILKAVGVIISFVLDGIIGIFRAPEIFADKGELDAVNYIASSIGTMVGGTGEGLKLDEGISLTIIIDALGNGLKWMGLGALLGVPFGGPVGSAIGGAIGFVIGTILALKGGNRFTREFDTLIRKFSGYTTSVPVNGSVGRNRSQETPSAMNRSSMGRGLPPQWTKNAVTAVGNAVNWAGDKVTDAWNWSRDTALNVFNSARAAASAALNLAKQGASSVSNIMSNAFGSVWDNIITAGQSVGNFIKGATGVTLNILNILSKAGNIDPEDSNAAEKMGEILKECGNLSNTGMGSSIASGREDNNYLHQKYANLGRGVENSPYYQGNYDNSYNMNDSGCGPIAASYLANIAGANVHPLQIAKMMKGSNYRTNDGATSMAGIQAVGQSFGIPMNTYNINNRDLDNEPSVLLGRSNDPNSPFTSAGHFVVSEGIDQSGNLQIMDPLNPKGGGVYPASSILRDVESVTSLGYGRGRGLKVENEQFMTNKSGSSITDNDGNAIKQDALVGKIESTVGSLGEALLYPILTVERFLQEWKRNQYETDEKGNYLLDVNGKKIPKGMIGDSIKETIGGLYGLVNNVFTGINQGISNNSASSITMSSSNSSDKALWKPWTWFGRGGGLQSEISSNKKHQPPKKIVSPSINNKKGLAIGRGEEVTNTDVDSRGYPSSSAGYTSTKKWSNISDKTGHHNNPFSVLHGFPFYRQGGAPWSTNPYRADGENGTIAEAGCGPTSMAMVLSAATGKFENPADVGQWSMNHGFKAKGQGTYHSFFDNADTSFPKQHGLVSENGKNKTFIDTSLSKGKPVIIVGSGSAPFTSGGHFTTVVGKVGDQYLVNDPNNKSGSYPWSAIERMRNGWSFADKSGKGLLDPSYRPDPNSVMSVSEGSFNQSYDENGNPIGGEEDTGTELGPLGKLLNGIKSIGSAILSRIFGITPDGSGISQKGGTGGHYDSNGNYISGTGIIDGPVELWPTIKVAKYGSPRREMEVIDLLSGESFKCAWALQSDGTYHTDWTPMTQQDIITLEKMQPGVSWTDNRRWNGRPGVLKLDGKMIAVGYHLRPHASLQGANPGYPFTDQPDTQYCDGVDGPKWPRIGGHMCMYYGDSNGGTPSCNEAAIQAVKLGNERFKEQQSAISARLPGTDNEDKAFNFFLAKGVSPEATSAIIGTLKKETTTIDPNRYQSGGGAGRGIFQWTHGSDRWDGLNALARQKGTQWNDLNTQLEYAWNEMSTPGSFNNKCFDASYIRRDHDLLENYTRKGTSPLPGGWNEYMRLNDVDRASRIFDAAFTRSGDSVANGRTDTRNRLSQEAYQRYKSQAIQLASATTPQSGFDERGYPSSSAMGAGPGGILPQAKLQSRMRSSYTNRSQSNYQTDAIGMGLGGKVSQQQFISTEKGISPIIQSSPVIPAKIPKTVQRNISSQSYRVPVGSVNENIFESVSLGQQNDLTIQLLKGVLIELQNITGNTGVASEYLDIISRKEFGVDEGLRSGISQLAKSQRRHTPFPTNHAETRSIQRMIRPS